MCLRAEGQGAEGQVAKSFGRLRPRAGATHREHVVCT